MKDFLPALKITLVFTLLTGGVFPALIWAIAQVAFPDQANGSLLYGADGKLVGSKIIGQAFAAPKYFHPRPSAAGNGYDPTSSGGTNLGPTSQKLFEGAKDDPSTPNVDESFTGVKDLVAAYRTENGLSADTLVPVDAVTRSASGLDSDISPANALFQSDRVARERGLPKQQVVDLINGAIQERFLGIFGERRVNVLLLNEHLDELAIGH